MAEENINQILGIEESSNNESQTPALEAQTAPQSNAAENVLNVIANVVLWVGLIVTLFCLFTLTTTKVVDPTYHYSIHYDTVFNPGGLVISVGVLLSTVTTWALLKVVANISKNLKEINAKMN